MFATATEVHVWRARLDGGEWPGSDGLPAEERERAARLRRDEARRRWVAARWALRGVLGRYLGQQPAAIELRSGSRGKPMLASPGASLRFNLSHSGDLTLVAIAQEQEVGVDVEQIEPRRDLLALARRALMPAEAAGIEATAPESRLVAFHAAWTRREAIAKCLGTGLGAPLPDTAVAVSDLDAGPRFAAAIAVAADSLPPLRHFTL
jgi:4'-phosphopantetheinyl transferase